MKLVFATHNLHKAKELRSLLCLYDIDLLFLNDFPDIKDIKETGSTFTENAMIKAETIFGMLKIPVLADDSGLEVEYLKGLPGIYSKRYAGKDADDTDRINKLLREMKNVPFVKRKAGFVCSLVLKDAKNRYKVTGFCSGFIADRPVGKNGFGYDPVFFLPDLKKTMAQLDRRRKNMISHRANAFKQIKEILIDVYKLKIKK